jgi:hypothetical protein
MTTPELLAISSILFSILIALIGYIGSKLIEYVKQIADSLRNLEIEFGILKNDHKNLKEFVHQNRN